MVQVLFTLLTNFTAQVLFTGYYTFFISTFLLLYIIT
jgi:hypothetical protein